MFPPPPEGLASQVSTFTRWKMVPLLGAAIQYPHYHWGWLVKTPHMNLQWGYGES